MILTIASGISDEEKAKGDDTHINYLKGVAN